MELQSVTERVGGMVEALGGEMAGLMAMIQRNPGSVTLIVALLVGVLIWVALSTR